MEKTLHKLIKHQREQIKHMTQEEFSIFTNTTIRTVQKWESGETIPGASNMRMIFSETPDVMEEAFALRTELLEKKKKQKKPTKVVPAKKQKKPKIKKETSTENVSSKESTEKEEANFLKVASQLTLERYYRGCEGQAYKLYGKGFKVSCNKRGSANTIVIGPPACGKQRNYIQPNLSATDESNFVIVTINADRLLNTFSKKENKKKKLLSDYDIKMIDVQNLAESAHVNPFLYFEDHYDVYNFANNLINESETFEKEDSFALPKSELLFLAFLLVRYLYSDKLGYNYPAENYNLLSAIDLLKERQKDEQAFEKAIDKVKQRDHITGETIIYLYNVLKRVQDCTEKTIQAALASLCCQLSILESEKYRKIIKDDNMCLYDFFEFNKKAVVVNANPHDLQSNLFSYAIVKMLLNMHGKHIPAQHTKFIIDEAASFKIGNLSMQLAINKCRNYSIDLIYQSLDQIRMQYPMEYQGIIANCNVVAIQTNERAIFEYLLPRIACSANVLPFYATRKAEKNIAALKKNLATSNDKWIVFLLGEKALIVEKNDEV